MDSTPFLVTSFILASTTASSTMVGAANNRFSMRPLPEGLGQVNQTYGHVSAAMDALMYTGECIRTKENVEIVDGLVSRFGMVLIPNRNMNHDGFPKGLHIKVLWYVESKVLARHLGKRVAQPECPNNRTAIVYPPAYTSTNMTQWISHDSILSEAFVFYPRDTDSGQASLAVGMENAICVSTKWKHGQENVVSISANQASPFGELITDSYSLRNYEFLHLLGNVFQKALCKIGSYARNSLTIRVSCLLSQWLYLKRRLPQLEVCLRPDSTFTQVVMRGFGAREAIKSKVTLELLRVDTDRKVSIVERVLGKAVKIGVRLVPRNQQPLRKRDGPAIYSAKLPLTNQRVYGFFSLGDVPDEDNPPKLRTTRRGFDFLYNPLSKVLCICLRFKEGLVKDPVISQSLMIRTIRQAGPDDDSSSDDESLLGEDNDGNDLIAVDVGVEFQAGNNVYAVKVVPTEALPDLVECEVIESDVSVPLDSRPQLWKAYPSTDDDEFIYRRIRQPPLHSTDIIGPNITQGVPAHRDTVYFKIDPVLELIRQYHLA